MGSCDLLVEVRDKVKYNSVKTRCVLGHSCVSARTGKQILHAVSSHDDLFELSESELLDGWQDQSVVKVQRIKIRHDNKEIPTKHIISTFGNSDLPESIETGHCKLHVGLCNPNPR